MRDSGPAFTVMTYNVLFKNTHIDSTLAEIKRHDADILALQELVPPAGPEIIARLSAQYPYRSILGGNGLFSRYPLESCELYPSPDGYGDAIQACRTLVLERPVTVLNLHPRPPTLSLDLLPGVSLYWPVDLDRHKNTTDFQGVFSVLEEIQGPVILLGDLNVSDRFDVYARLESDLKDAFQERGWGLGLTLTRFPPRDIPLWRIDYVFYSPDFTALEARVGDNRGSDHRPVIARLGFAGE